MGIFVELFPGLRKSVRNARNRKYGHELVGNELRKSLQLLLSSELGSFEVRDGENPDFHRISLWQMYKGFVSKMRNFHVSDFKWIYLRAQEELYGLP